MSNAFQRHNSRRVNFKRGKRLALLGGGRYGRAGPSLAAYTMSWPDTIDEDAIREVRGANVHELVQEPFVFTPDVK